MRVVDRIALVYLLYLCVAAFAVPLPMSRRLRVLGACAATGIVIALVGGATNAGSGRWLLLIRDWSPPLVVLAAYWIPAGLVTGIDRRAERALHAFDTRWAARPISTIARAPTWVTELLELAYLLCYPLLPAGFAVAVIWGPPVNVDRFWTAVVLSAASSYGLLPWIRTRPPREIEPELPGRRSHVRRINELLLDRASVKLNTFPSGHVATSVATALAATSEVPVAGLVLIPLAFAIAVACVVRRYHYLGDVLTGAFAGVFSAGVARML